MLTWRIFRQGSSRSDWDLDAKFSPHLRRLINDLRNPETILTTLIVMTETYSLHIAKYICTISMDRHVRTGRPDGSKPSALLIFNCTAQLCVCVSGLYRLRRAQNLQLDNIPFPSSTKLHGADAVFRPKVNSFCVKGFFLNAS